MLNHREVENCTWTIRGDLRRDNAAVLVKAKRRLSPGTEVCIQYSNEGNEALLFCYGFVVENNMSDVVMLRCPLGPRSEWDEVMAEKVKLMTVCFSKISRGQSGEESELGR
jgi:hypothetical protein